MKHLTTHAVTSETAVLTNHHLTFVSSNHDQNHFLTLTRQLQSLKSAQTLTTDVAEQKIRKWEPNHLFCNSHFQRF